MKDHIVTAFDTELKSLARSIEEMGTLARQSVVIAAGALGQRSPDLAGQVAMIDEQIDALQREIEESGILVIARRQPVAFDLREVVCALRISNDLERIGDLANNIAKRVVALGKAPAPHPLVSGLEGLSTLVIERLDVVLEAFAARDPDKAAGIWSSDADVDDLYTSVFRGILTYMMEDPRNITPCTQLVFVAKNLERIGDHVSNIAEAVHYAATGALLDEPRSGQADAVGAAEVAAG